MLRIETKTEAKGQQNGPSAFSPPGGAPLIVNIKLFRLRGCGCAASAGPHSCSDRVLLVRTWADCRLFYSNPSGESCCCSRWSTRTVGNCSMLWWTSTAQNGFTAGRSTRMLRNDQINSHMRTITPQVSVSVSKHSSHCSDFLWVKGQRV